MIRCNFGISLIVIKRKFLYNKFLEDVDSRLWTSYDSLSFLFSLKVSSKTFLKYFSSSCNCIYIEIITNNNFRP